jgi:hypothetical protein
VRRQTHTLKFVPTITKNKKQKTENETKRNINYQLKKYLFGVVITRPKLVNWVNECKFCPFGTKLCCGRKLEDTYWSAEGGETMGDMEMSDSLKKTPTPVEAVASNVSNGGLGAGAQSV